MPWDACHPPSDSTSVAFSVSWPNVYLVISAVLRTTILQAAVPDAFRSRISSLQIAVVEGGPRLGDLEAGAVATAASTEFAVISGGLACIAGAILLAGLLPGFRHLCQRSEPLGDDLPAAPPDTTDAARAADAIDANRRR